MSQRLRIALSLACALAAALACAAYTSHVRGEAERARSEELARYGGEVVTLVVSTRVLEAGDVVAASDVCERDWLSSLVPDDAILNLDEVVGREVTEPVACEAPLTELNFRDASGMAPIPAGHVAISVPTSEKLGVSGSVSVGSHLVAYRSDEDKVEAIAADVVVLAAPGSNGTSMGRSAITIAITVDEVASVLAASAEGSLRLVVPASDVVVAQSSEDGLREVKPVSDEEKSAEEAKTEDSQERAGAERAGGED